MKRIVPALIASLLAVTAGSPATARASSIFDHAAPAVAFRVAEQTPATTPATTKVRLHAARTFSLALGAKLTAVNLARLARRDLVVVDGEDATAAQVTKLRSRGALVLGYLSVGSVESWRSWFPLLQDHRLEPLGDWDGERYADVSSSELRDAIADTIAPSLLEKGFDGLFLDNVDMIEDHPAQADGMFDLVTRLSARVHTAGGVLMAQNGDAVIAKYLPLLDAWNREDPTGTYDFSRKRYVLTDAAGRRLARATLKSIHAAGLVTTTTDYFGSPRSADAKRAVRIACSVGALPLVADIALSDVPKTPQRCSKSAAKRK